LLFAYAISSRTFCAGTAGFSTSIPGGNETKAIDAKSLNGSYLRFLYRLLATMMLPNEPMISV